MPDSETVERIEKLQSSVEALTRDVADTAATVRSLAGTVGSVVSRQNELERVQRDAGKLNWAPVAIMATVIISVATISGGLIAYAIASESEARVTGDAHLDRLLGAVLQERTQTDTAQRESVDQASQFRQEVVQSNVAMVEQRVDELSDRLDRIAERSATETTRLDTELEHRFTDIDAVLQREMRLLDEILQREMGLHVKRLDELIDGLDVRVRGVENSRFTGEDGERVERRLDAIEQRRTP